MEKSLDKKKHKVANKMSKHDPRTVVAKSLGKLHKAATNIGKIKNYNGDLPF